MPKINDGGPAFPRPIGEAHGLHHKNVNTAQDGMSLRDYFAAYVASSLFNWSATDRNIEATARLCFKIADAMIEAREEKS